MWTQTVNRIFTCNVISLELSYVNIWKQNMQNDCCRAVGNFLHQLWWPWGFCLFAPHWKEFFWWNESQLQKDSDNKFNSNTKVTQALMDWIYVTAERGLKGGNFMFLKINSVKFVYSTKSWHILSQGREVEKGSSWNKGVNWGIPVEVSTDEIRAHLMGNWRMHWDYRSSEKGGRDTVKAYCLNFRMKFFKRE